MADDTIMATPVSPKKPKVKKRLGKDIAKEEAKPSKSSEDLLPWISLTGRSSAKATCYTHDGGLFFVASGSSTKVYDATTSPYTLLSTLSIPQDVSEGDMDREDGRVVSCICISPQNAMQLLVGSMDGFIRIWDYTNGILTRSIDVGSPLTQMTAHSAHPSHVFVGTCSLDVQKGKKSAVCRVSLKKNVRSGALRRKILTTKHDIIAIRVSTEGKHIVAATPLQLYVMLASDLHSGWVRFNPPNAITCIAVHPTEKCLATGDDRGAIRLYYCFDEEWWQERTLLQQQTGEKHPLAGPQSSAVFHWHAHPVGGIDFTPNGAYMLSVGYEGVLVFWQIATGSKDFLPRLGGPIADLCISPVSALNNDKEQEVAVIMSDGTILFVATQSYTVKHAIASMKQDSSANQSHEDVWHNFPISVITKGSEKIAVLPSSHPSSLQFYSIDQDKHLFELEVAPSNRIAPRRGTTDEINLEPCRVQKIAFSEPIDASSKSTRWMATYDTWQSGEYEAEDYLKFWHVDLSRNRHALLSTVRRPHHSQLTSAVFHPGLPDGTPRLLTTAVDGSIKIWSCDKLKTANYASNLVWYCSREFRMGQMSAYDAAFSVDGTVLAIAHGQCISLWQGETLQLLRTIPLVGASEAQQIAFTGKEGNLLIARCRKHIIGWSLLDFKECLRLDIAASSLIPGIPLSENLHILAPDLAGAPDKTSILNLVKNGRLYLSSVGLRQSVDHAAIIADNAAQPSLLAHSANGELLMTGESAKRVASLGSIATIKQSAAKPVAGSFQDIFGTTLSTVATDKATQTAAGVASSVSKKGDDQVLNYPSHLLPSIQSLWRSLITLPPKNENSEMPQIPRPMDVDEIDPPTVANAKISAAPAVDRILPTGLLRDALSS